MDKVDKQDFVTKSITNLGDTCDKIKDKPEDVRFVYKALKPFELGTFELSHLAKETIVSTASTPDHNTVEHESIAVFSHNTLDECEAPPDANREDRINFNTGYDVLHASSYIPQVQQVD